MEQAIAIIFISCFVFYIALVLVMIFHKEPVLMGFSLAIYSLVVCFMFWGFYKERADYRTALRASKEEVSELWEMGVGGKLNISNKIFCSPDGRLVDGTLSKNDLIKFEAACKLAREEIAKAAQAQPSALPNYKVLTSAPEKYLIEIDGNKTCWLDRDSLRTIGWETNVTIKEIRHWSGACRAVAEDLRKSAARG